MEGEEGEGGSGSEGRHRHGVVMSCFFQTFNLDFTPRSPLSTLSYLRSLSLRTFAHLIRLLHLRNGLIATCRWCEQRSNLITASCITAVTTTLGRQRSRSQLVCTLSLTWMYKVNPWRLSTTLPLVFSSS